MPTLRSHPYLAACALLLIPLAAGEQSGTIDSGAAHDFATQLSVSRAVTSAWVPAICFTFGCLLVILGVLMFMHACSKQVAPAPDTAYSGAQADNGGVTMAEKLPSSV